MRKGLTSLVVCICLGSTASARADAVTFWNDVTAEALTIGRPGGHGFLDMALVQAAVHDAVQAIQRRFEPYAADLEGSGAPAAAAAAAAHGVLVGIYPKQQNIFDAKYKEFLASNGLAGDPGLSVGQQVVAALLKHHRPAPEMPDTYKRFSDAAQEVVDARILLGIHFRFADEVARTQGSRVANWTFERFLRPRTDGRK